MKEIKSSQPDTVYLYLKTETLTSYVYAPKSSIISVEFHICNTVIFFCSEFIEEVFNHEWGSNLLLQCKYKTIKSNLNLSKFEIKKWNFLGTIQEWNDAMNTIRLF